MKETTLCLRHFLEVPTDGLGPWKAAVSATKLRLRESRIPVTVEESVEIQADGSLLLKLCIGGVSTQARVLRGEWRVKAFSTLEPAVRRKVARAIAGHVPVTGNCSSWSGTLFGCIEVRGYRCADGAFSFFFNDEGPFDEPLEDELAAVLHRMMGHTVANPRP